MSTQPPMRTQNITPTPSVYEIVINGATQTYQQSGVTSFVGHDLTGSFGILASREPLLTCLRPGMARFCAGDQWHYIAQPGAVLIFANNQLRLSTSQFVVSDEPGSLVPFITKEWLAAETDAGHTKRSVAQVEQALARKLWDLTRKGNQA